LVDAWPSPGGRCWSIFGFPRGSISVEILMSSKTKRQFHIYSYAATQQRLVGQGCRTGGPVSQAPRSVPPGDNYSGVANHTMTGIGELGPGSPGLIPWSAWNSKIDLDSLANRASPSPLLGVRFLVSRETRGRSRETRVKLQDQIGIRLAVSRQSVCIGYMSASHVASNRPCPPVARSPGSTRQHQSFCGGSG
jgi:hypothetical protein